MCCNVSASPVIGAKWDKQNLGNYKFSFEKNEKPSLKITRTEEISKFCNKIIYLLNWNGVYI